MGQARIRGTFDQRRALVIQLQHEEHMRMEALRITAAKEEADRINAMPEEQRNLVLTELRNDRYAAMRARLVRAGLLGMVAGVEMQP